MQTKLINNENFDKNRKVLKLLNDFKKEYSLNKIIKFWGNIDSEIMILGEAPVESHYKSNSKNCFCFDINNDKILDNKSGSVLIKVFKDLHIDINKLFFHNIYQIPLSMINEDDKIEHEKLLVNIINVLNIKKIVCLGRNVEKVINNMSLENIKKEFVYHPAYVTRNSNYYDRYRMMWERLNIK